jgi:hypothetical protein
MITLIVISTNLISSFCEWIKTARYHGMAQSFAAKMRYDLYHSFASKCQIEDTDAQTTFDTDHSVEKFDMRKINEDIQIL